MAIDAMIPLMAKGIDGMQVLENGSKIAQMWQQDRANQELDRIYNESQGDVGKMLTLGQQSKMARYIVPQIQAQQSAQQKAALDLQKTQAEIANTNAQATERNANAGNTVFDTSNKKFGAIQGAISQAAMTGDKTVAMLALDGLRSAGVIKPEDYMSNVQLLNAMQPEDVKKWASGAVFGNTKDQGSYLFQTANNAADNAQSNTNNIRTTNASIYSTDTAAATADKNRAQDRIIEEQKLSFQKGEIKEIMTGTDGKAYAIYRDGRVEPSLLPNGQAFAPQPKASTMSPTVQKELFETEDAIAGGSAVISAINDALKLNSNSYDGAALGRAQSVGFFGGTEAAKNTTLIDNIITGNALNSLKATFGAAPTEGERKILLDLQGSVNLPREQRAAIWERAKEAAARRLETNQAKANGLRDGTYLKPEQQTTQATNAPKGSYMTLSDVKTVAKNAGISVDEAVQRLQSKGVTIR